MEPFFHVIDVGDLLMEFQNEVSGGGFLEGGDPVAEPFDAVGRGEADHVSPESGEAGAVGFESPGRRPGQAFGDAVETMAGGLDGGGGGDSVDEFFVSAELVLSVATSAP